MISNGWMPIDEAPKDGTPFLGWTAADGAMVTFWQSGGTGQLEPKFGGFLTKNRAGGHSWNPSHFMFLPDPPTT